MATLGTIITRLTHRHVMNRASFISSRCFHDDSSRQEGNFRYRRAAYFGTIVGAVGLTASSLVAYNTIQASGNEKSTGKQTSQLRTYTREDVSKHDSLANGVWITYKGNVYDITEFVQHHPGGGHTIMLGAGGDVEPFWQTYTVHQAAEVQKLLASYQIGVLSQEDILRDKELKRVQVTDGPYANDPSRSPLLQVLSKQPYNAETPSRLLTPTQITPTEVFFIRNHLPVPEVDIDDYTLTICLGSDGDPDNQQVVAEFTLDDLKTKFKKHTIESVVQCSGNRRTDLKKLKEIKGLDWKVGAIGNARWSGVRLVDVFESLGLKQDENITHVQAEGLDCDMTGQAYAASISADVAFDPKRDVLLAYEMNGEPLNRDHGFPVRFIAPGVTGARNVKWLGKIILSHEESHGHWQRNDYKSFSPNIDMFNLDYSKSISIQETPVQSAICEPNDGESITLKRMDGNLILPVKGYAYSGGGKMIIRVDVSIDGGKTWMTANLLDSPTLEDGNPDYSNRNRVWSWTRWSLDAPLSEKIIVSDKTGAVEVLCRAFDSTYNSQPERAETIWNVRGVMNNSWHKIRLNLKVE